MDKDIVNSIFALAARLLTDKAPQHIIDSEFYFGIWCDDWINRVKDFRKKYWGNDEAPFSPDDAGSKAFLKWFGAFSKGRDTANIDEWKDWLEYGQLLKQLAIDYRLSESAVRQHVQQGMCPPLPTASLHVHKGEELATPKPEQAGLSPSKVTGWQAEAEAEKDEEAGKVTRDLLAFSGTHE